MARYENALSTLQARTILSSIYNTSVPLVSRTAIENVALSIVDNLELTFPEQFPKNDFTGKKDNLHYSYLSFALSACAKFAVRIGDLKILDYISMLSDIKEENEKNLKDFGAFGDLFEILIRCAFMKKISLVKWSTLSVKDIKTADIISDTYGIIEVGHNGKSLTFGTLFDFMDGDYNAIVYGVFSEEDKKEVYRLCHEKQYEKAIDFVTSYSCYWDNKYTFQNDMDNLTRGKGLTVKSGTIQVVYNAGKYNAFVNAIEEGRFQCLYDMLGR